MAVHWNDRFLHLKTVSLFVNRWLTNTLTGKAKVSTKATNEMLIQRRLNIFSELVRKYMLVADAMLVKSNQNKADRITRVLQRWLEAMDYETEPVLQI